MRKTVLLLFFLPLFVVACFNSGNKDSNKVIGVTDTAAVNGFEINKKSAFSGTVAIVSVNDMHAAIDNMPRFAAVLDSLRSIYPDLILLSAGDNRTGNPINDKYSPTSYPMISLMNELGFNATTLGNHEFDAGMEGLRQNMNDANFDFLCANIKANNGSDLGIKPYTIIKQGDCSIAVVGMVQIGQSGLPSAHPDGLKELCFNDGRSEAKHFEQLKETCNVVLLLSHLGIDTDYEVADNCPFYDAILGGHSHTLIENPSQHNGVLVTQAGAKLNYATLTILELEDGNVTRKYAKTINLGRGNENKKIRQMVDDFNKNPALDKVIAYLSSNLNEKEEIGCLMTDAIRYGSNADFAFQNSGGIRVSYLKKGNLTIKDVYTIDPFDNDVVVFKMTGAQVKKFIIESFKRNRRNPSFVSGMTYNVTVTDDNYPKSAYVIVDNGNFSTKKEYKVAMSGYMASTVTFDAMDEGTSMFKTTSDMLIDYATKMKQIDYKGVIRTSVKHE